MENKEKLQTVVQGEASESDEEDDVNDEIIVCRIKTYCFIFSTLKGPGSFRL